MSNLKRSKSNKVFSGVCGGLGEFLNIDPTIIRIVWALFIVKSFSFSFLIYLLCSIIIPSSDDVLYSDSKGNSKNGLRNTRFIVGGGLIVWGGILLAELFFPEFRIQLSYLVKYWPGLLIILGIYIISSSKK